MILKISLILLSLSCSAFKQAKADFQAIPMGAYEELNKDDSFDSISLEEVEDPFLSGSLSDQPKNLELENETDQLEGHVSDTSFDREITPMSEVNENDKARSPGPHSSGQTESYYEINDKKTIKKLSALADHNLGFHFFYDTYDYENGRGSFKRIFRGESGDGEKADSDPAGGILVTYLRYLNQGNFKFGWGLTSGLGYNGGRGFFRDDNSISNDAKVFLWTLPIELLVSASMNMTRYFNLTLKGGPAVLGLIQHRKDLPDSDKRKILRQVGYGYTAALEFNISLSSFFPGLGIDYHRNYDAAQVYLSPFIKTVSYSGFREEGLEIGGTSFGLGLSLDLL